MMAGRKRRAIAHVSRVAASVLLVVGAVLLFWTDLAGLRNQVAFDERIEFVSEVRSCLAGSDASSQEVAVAAESLAAAHDVLEAYNAKVAAGETVVNDSFSGNQEQESLSALVAGDGLVGSVSIPAMNCRLPLYFGATYDNLAQGAAVVSGTSFPLGSTSSNCVIAAHRGWNSAAFFRDIEDISEGDELTVETPWGKYRYHAVGFVVIDPNDTDAVRVFPGMDMVTLVTCHPYGQNAQRYVAYFEREGEQLFSREDVVLEDSGTALQPSGSGLLRAERIAKLGCVIAVVAMAASVVLRRARC